MNHGIMKHILYSFINFITIESYNFSYHLIGHQKIGNHK